MKWTRSLLSRNDYAETESYRRFHTHRSCNNGALQVNWQNKQLPKPTDDEQQTLSRSTIENGVAKSIAFSSEHNRTLASKKKLNQDEFINGYQRELTVFQNINGGFAWATLRRNFK